MRSVPGIVIVLPLVGDPDRYVGATYALHASGALIVATSQEDFVYPQGQWLRVTALERTS